MKYLLDDICTSLIRGPFGSALKKEFFVEPSQSTYKVYEQGNAIRKSKDYGQYYITAEKFNELKRFEVNPYDFIMSCSGTIGELYQLPKNAEKGVINQALLKMTLNEDIIDADYFYYMFKHNLTQLESKGSGIQNVASIKILKQMEFDIPDLEQQRRIVSIIKKSVNLIEARNAELEKLDELIKARFVELFGDPIENPRNLGYATLDALSELITKGASPSWQGFSYTDDSSQTLFITSENVREGYIDLSNPKYIEDGFNDKQKRSVLKKGDFLINIVGASIGRAAQFNLVCKANMNQAAALVRIADERIRDKYLTIYLNSEKAQQMYDSMKSDTGRANLSLQDIANLKILLPQVEEQIEFENFVEQVDKSKVAVKKSLDDTQLLFDSLMQKYFG